MTRQARKNHPGVLCADCGRGAEYFMLWDSVWRASVRNRPAHKLCVDCLQKRLGRPLARYDFDPRFWGETNILLALKPSRQLKSRLGPRSWHRQNAAIIRERFDKILHKFEREILGKRRVRRG